AQGILPGPRLRPARGLDRFRPVDGGLLVVVGRRVIGPGGDDGPHGAGGPGGGDHGVPGRVRAPGRGRRGRAVHGPLRRGSRPGGTGDPTHRTARATRVRARAAPHRPVVGVHHRARADV